TEERHRARAFYGRAHSLARGCVGFHVVFHEICSLPFEPLPHFLRVLARFRSVKLKRRHGRAPLTPRESRGTPRLEFPECAECNRNERSAENQRDRGGGFHRRRNRGELL